MSKFLRVKCACGNEQNIFAQRAQAQVKCLVCGAMLADADRLARAGDRGHQGNQGPLKALACARLLDKKLISYA